IDHERQKKRLGHRIEAALARVLEHGQYVMGPEVAELERRLQAFTGARHAIACASGTDALLLALMARGLRPGDAVLVPTFTFVATAEAVALAGGVPVFADVREDSFNLDPAALDPALRAARDAGARAAGVIAVGLFGQPAAMAAIRAFCERHGLWLIDDAAQSFGATLDGQPVGRLASLTATSFFPAKPLGCYGDGGAVLTDDDQAADVIRSLRVHGQGRDKYDNVRIGINGRLDTLQAAVLLEKLRIFEDEIRARARIAGRYGRALDGVVGVPELVAGASSVWAQYTLTVPAGRRDEVARHLAGEGIPSAIYYPIPLHMQTAYRTFPRTRGGLPVAERLAGTVLSLPMHAYLSEVVQDRITDAVRAALRA
ncbi:MAG: DegT/DnrJ/EryC1/StrS family aminotransferase, partial [Geminicoccaceae bacterium]|nr:DegT/DnrJ/EryC1/StrS family aminotransferase [Geminicoccaceae bacterium]